VTTAALAVGLLAVNLVKPGVGVTLPPEAGSDVTALAGNQPTLGGVLEHTVPQSFFEAAARNEVLQIVFFAILFAVSLSKVEGRPKQFFLEFCESLSQIMFKFVGLVMAFAPVGIGAAIAVTVGKSGIGVLRNLAILVGTLYGALAVFILLVLVPVMLVARVPVARFARTVREPALIAFSTASSEAALPRAMQAMEAFGVPRRIVAFVMPTGYSFNLDGSTLYLALASVFAAQAAGVDMPIGTQLLMMLTLMLTSKGVAAVPRASLVILSGALTQFNLPLSAIAVILGVDALMDMARTSVNLVGNCLATAVMARWEGVLGEEPAVAARAQGELEAAGTAAT
jgi:proton glutamate symport protein